jgi:phosphohistidine phosphatase
MRHGEAVPYHANDKSRALTRFGEAQVQSGGKRLAKFFQERSLEPSVEQVLVSPFLRTQQTYQALQNHINFQNELDTDLITPNGNVQDVHDVIDGYGIVQNPNNSVEVGVKQLMLVSHMPLVSLLADQVCKGFNGKIFDTADILIIDYNLDTNTGQQLAFFQNIN